MNNKYEKEVNMKKIKIIIIMLMIIILMAIIVFIYSKNINEKNNNQTLGEFIVKVDENIKDVEQEMKFFTVEECVQKYYKYIGAQYEQENQGDYPIKIDESRVVTGIKDEQSKREAIFSILDKYYIDKNNISSQNVLDFVDNMDGYINFVAEDMQVLEGEEIDKYFVKGSIYKSMQKIEDKVFIVKLSRNNVRFSIIPVEETNMEDLKLVEYDEPVASNSFNSFQYKDISEEELVNKYFADYKRQLTGNIENAYNLLNNEYRDNKFQTLENFEAYIKTRNLTGAYLSQYNIYNFDDYTQYVCIDQNGDYYIFNIEKLMKYNVMLDTYSIQLPQFIEKYEKANSQEKAGMNIEKILNAMNYKDYNYIYNKLDEEFRNSKFNNIENLAEYINNNFYEKNTIEYNTVTTEGELIIYKIKIKNANDDSEGKDVTIIMKLIENNDFIMSFSID